MVSRSDELLMDGGNPLDVSDLVDESGNIPLRYQPPEDSGRVPHGHCVAYRDGGQLHIEITYDQGVADGPYRDYWSEGHLACEGQYVGGVQEGEWRFYHQDGTLMEIIQFRGGKEVRT